MLPRGGRLLVNISLVLISFVTVYVDPYQLQSFSDRGFLPRFTSLASVDVEAPVSRTNSSLLLTLIVSQDGLKARNTSEICIPIHARYQVNASTLLITSLYCVQTPQYDSEFVIITISNPIILFSTLNVEADLHRIRKESLVIGFFFSPLTSTKGFASVNQRLVATRARSRRASLVGANGTNVRCMHHVPALLTIHAGKMRRSLRMSHSVCLSLEP